MDKARAAVVVRFLVGVVVLFKIEEMAMAIASPVRTHRGRWLNYPMGVRACNPDTLKLSRTQ